MRSRAFGLIVVWPLLSVLLAPLIVLARSIPSAIGNADRGGSFVFGLLVFARIELEVYALPLLILILVPIALHTGASLLWRPWDSWIVILLVLPAVTVFCVWLGWIYTSSYSESQGVDLAKIAVLTVVMPRILVTPLRPGRLSAAPTPAVP